jgi:hypothetical protein
VGRASLIIAGAIVFISILVTTFYYLEQQKLAPVPAPNVTLTYEKGLIFATFVEYTPSWVPGQRPTGVNPDVVFAQGIENDIAAAKELGANLIVATAEILYSPEGLKIKQKARLIQIINTAHHHGLAVELRGGGIAWPEEKPENITAFLLSLMPSVAEAAKFARKYRVYSFVPFGEIDTAVGWGHFWVYGEFAESLDEKPKSAFVQTLLKTIREHYDGRVGLGWGEIGELEDGATDVSGYDFIETSVLHRTRCRT